MNAREKRTERYQEQDRDEQLIETIAQGDVFGLRRLYFLYGGLAHSIASNILGGDKAEAEEVVQDVFLKIWNASSQFDPKLSSPKGWVCLIARRRSIDVLRKRKRRPDRDGERKESLDILDFENLSSGGFDRVRRYGILDERLRLLRPDYRECLRLAYLKGYEQKEIAHKMGLPLGSVKTFIRRGLDQLRKAFTDGQE